MQAIIEAEFQYETSYPANGFACSLSALGGEPRLRPAVANFRAVDSPIWPRATSRLRPPPYQHVIPYVQWQVIQSGATRLFLAVDTTCGDPDLGYFRESSAMTKDFQLRLDGLLDLQGKPLRGIPPIEICIRPAAAVAGDAKHVHMVIDFGNSRTGALLLEMAGEISQTPQMMPFELLNRYHLDAFDENGSS